MSTIFNYPSKALQDELRQIARALVAPGKGIFAQDTDTENIGRKFKEIGVPNTEENRRTYRQVKQPFFVSKTTLDTVKIS